MDDARALWDAEAEHVDDEPDHGLHDEAARGMWTQVLSDVLPDARSRVLDPCARGPELGAARRRDR